MKISLFEEKNKKKICKLYQKKRIFFYVILRKITEKAETLHPDWNGRKSMSNKINFVILLYVHNRCGPLMNISTIISGSITMS